MANMAIGDRIRIRLGHSDDLFGLMEGESIKRKKIELLRNISDFAWLRCHIEVPQREESHYPVRGPRIFLPPPKPLQPVEVQASATAV
jgi:hypothetical protein